MKLKEFRSVQKKLNKATGKSLQCGFEKQGCFLRLENFPVPKDESEMNVSNADPRAEDSHCVQPWMRLIWGCRVAPAGLQLSSLKLARSHSELRKWEVSVAFQNAFDKAPHSRVTGQMTNCGLVRCVINGLSDRKQIISVQSCVTMVNAKPLMT